MPVLYNGAGRPEPSPEIARRLRSIDLGLRLQWIAGVAGNWAVLHEWPADSPKRRLVQDGTMPADKAFDIVGWLPMDCPLEQAPALIERMLRTYPNAEVQRLADRAQHWNDTKVGQESVEAAVAAVMDMPDPAAPKKRGRPRKEK